jgi:hypothetical protein
LQKLLTECPPLKRETRQRNRRMLPQAKQGRLLL